MLYFAYGSNLDPEQMRERCPNHVVVGLASLQEYRIGFPRFSNRWGGGTAGLQLAHGKVMWGVLYELTDDDLAKLDEYEGFIVDGDQHNAHDREHVTLELVRPDDGSIPRKVRAWAYVARPAHPAVPSRRYLDCILAGARHHRLPEEYIAELTLIETAEATGPPGTDLAAPEPPAEP
jgi:Gamma-glutamyl cyclotransferase, AIG2-like